MAEITHKIKFTTGKEIEITDMELEELRVSFGIYYYETPLPYAVPIKTEPPVYYPFPQNYCGTNKTGK